MSEDREKKMGTAAGAGDATARDASGPQPRKPVSATRHPGAKKKERRPLHAAAQVVVRFGAAHSRLAALGGCVAAVGMVVLLVWFTVFSGMAEPPQFVYASF